MLFNEKPQCQEKTRREGRVSGHVAKSGSSTES
jgi:hypothetical protein